MGVDDAALTAVVERTGIFPNSAAVKMRGDLISDDPERVMATMNRAVNAIRINPNVMDHVEGGAELKRATARFRTLIGTSMPARDAASRMVGERMPELQVDPQRQDPK